MRIAGQPRRGQESLIHVDFEAVMRQAVENERHRILRELRRAVDKVQTEEYHHSRGYGTKDRRPEEVKRDVLAALDRIERESNA